MDMLTELQGAAAAQEAKGPPGARWKPPRTRPSCRPRPPGTWSPACPAPADRASPAAFTQAFDRQEGLNTVPNWLYLTGSLSQLGAVWGALRDHGAEPAAGAWPRIMTWPWSSTGPVTSARRWHRPRARNPSTKSSFSVLLSQYARQALADSEGEPVIRRGAGLGRARA